MSEDKIVQDLLNQYPIQEQVQFDEFNIGDKLQENPYLSIQYGDILIRERSKLEELEELAEKLYGERYHYYRFEIDEELSKPEIEKYYLPKDKRVLQMKKILRNQKIRIRFFETCIKGLDRAY